MLHTPNFGQLGQAGLDLMDFTTAQQNQQNFMLQNNFNQLNHFTPNLAGLTGLNIPPPSLPMSNIAETIQKEANMSVAEMQKLMKPINGSVSKPFEYSESNDVKEVTKPEFSRPAMRRNKLKRDFNPFRDRIDYSHIKDPKERRRLRSLDNARLYRDKEKQRIMILEGGNQYYYDHNKRLHSNNLWLTQAIEKLEKYLSDQINAAAQQQQINQNINKNSTAAHPACIEQHIENGFSSISSVNTKDLTKITNFDSTQVSEVSPPENPGLKINETQEFSMLDETQIQNHLVANEGDSTQPSFSDIRDPTVPNLQINDSDIHAMSEKYRTEIQENLLENKLKSQAKQISVDQTVSRTDSNEKSSSSASNHLTKSSSSSSKNKLGLSLDLSNIKWSSSSGNSKNASGNSKNSTATTVKLNVANNSTLEKIKEIETENESPDIDSILSSESSDQVKLESMIPPAHPASKSTGRKTVKPQLYNPYGSMPSSVNQSQLSQLSQDLTAMFGQPETASTFAETPSCYGSAEPSPEELEMEKAKYGLKLADESQISQINYFNFENVGY